MRAALGGLGFLDNHLGLALGVLFELVADALGGDDRAFHLGFGKLERPDGLLLTGHLVAQAFVFV